MRDWYERYYRAIRTSRANALFCEAVYGRDLGQHGFMDDVELADLLARAALKPGDLALDLGCGDGRIAEAISDETGARLVGVDDSAEAIESATGRTGGKQDRLGFARMDVSRLALADGTFDAVFAVDSLYFAPLDDTIREAARVLKPSGRFIAYYTWVVPKDGSLGKESILPDRTPLAVALGGNGLTFGAWDYTAAHREHMHRRRDVLAELEALFVSEGNEFIFENRKREAEGIGGAIDDGKCSRHLYLATRHGGREQVGHRE